MKSYKSIFTSLFLFSTFSFATSLTQFGYPTHLKVQIKDAAQSANQNTAVDMRCVTEFPTTSFLTQEQGEEVVVDIIHHNGVQYTPFRDSLITPSDIALLSKQADLFLQLAPTMTFRWPKKSCEITSGMFFQCFGKAAPVIVNGLTVLPRYISMSEATHKLVGGYSFWVKTVSVNITVNNEDYTITNNFFDGDCRPSDRIPTQIRRSGM